MWIEMHMEVVGKCSHLHDRLIMACDKHSPGHTHVVGIKMMWVHALKLTPSCTKNLGHKKDVHANLGPFYICD